MVFIAEVDQSIWSSAKQLNVKTFLGQCHGRPQHAGMFDGRDDDVAAWFAAQSAERQIVGFGSSAGEDQAIRHQA